MNKDEIAWRIKELREDRHLQQKEVAAGLGISPEDPQGVRYSDGTLRLKYHVPVQLLELVEARPGSDIRM